MLASLAKTTNELAATLIQNIALSEQLTLNKRLLHGAMVALQERDKRIVALQDELDNLKPKHVFSPQRLFTTEQEEDAMWAHKHDQLSTAELNDILAELQFDNTTVYVDDEDVSTLTY